MLDQIAAALYQTPLLSVSAAFIWGIFSVILSPCHLSSIPLVIACVNQNGKLTVMQGFYVSLSFAGGIMITLLAAVLLAMTAGLLLSGIEIILQIIISIILLLGGLYFMGFLPDIKGVEMINHQFAEHPYRSSFSAGIMLGIGLGSCALAFMAPILSISISKFPDFPLFSIGMILSYVIGHCLIIGLSGLFTGEIKKIFKFSQQSRGTKIIKYISGGLMIILAIYNFVKIIQ